MKIKSNTANAKRAHIQTLLYLGQKPELKVLEPDVPAAQAREREAHWIRRHPERWMLAGRELIYSGADAETTARALGRTVEAVRSHANLYVSSTGFASTFVIEALQAAFNMRAVDKLKCPPTVGFYSDEPRSNVHEVPAYLLAFAKSLKAG